MNSNPIPMDQLDDILAGVHLELEDGATADRINQIANENPQLRAEILAFAAEWFASDGSDLSDDILTVQQTVSEHTILLERFWQLTMPAAIDPFEKLSTDDLQALAERCRVDLIILRQLVRGRIDETTIPGKLIAWLADATGASMADVWSHLASGQINAAADYFAPSGRRTGAKISFAEAIRSSDLSPDDKQFWLAHLEA
ncbi:MAG: hypothetical protein E5X74_31400 [Mesorhizobium sp.]|uniref:hypothetical protein n=1 Tax=Mesorhizobium sp. TaxID=1871066 RepID=UPI00081990BC|nr:hypothetical protein [Mesorhizobium sp.]TIO80807.1 MAG: hypothetical protein E5X74_31400 [Mesorhizobium sp.]BAV50367.1 Uncharacterized protein MLTONO_5465 [Mesorhizobium loti]